MHAGQRLCMVFFLGLIGCSSRPDAKSVFLPEGLSGPRPSISEAYALDIDEERVALTREYFGIHHPGLNLPEGVNENAIRFDPRLVVVHYTVTNPLEKLLAQFQNNHIASDRGKVTLNGGLNVGIQFIVDRDGAIYSSYPETIISRHVIGLNHVAIGIENVANGDLEARNCEAPLTRAQLAANVALIRYLAGKYPNLNYMIGHMEYRDLEDPNHPAHHLFYEEIPTYRTEKTDPGPRFLAALRKALKKALNKT